MNGRIVDSTGFSKTDGAVRRIVRLNIGLNNNRYDLDMLLRMSGELMDIDSHFVAEGEYNGDVEPTLVVTGLTEIGSEDLENNISVFSMLAGQDCIAYKLGGKGVLAYRLNWAGDKYEFDEQYFI